MHLWDNYDTAFTEPEKTMDAFTQSYIETLLWSENDESTPQGGVPFDKNYDIDDIHPDSLEVIQRECKAFQTKLAGMDTDDMQAKDFAHDFVLTRNGHGAGFWDGDYDHLGKGTVDALCKLAKSFHPCHLILGDDGHVHYWTEWKGN